MSDLRIALFFLLVSGFTNAWAQSAHIFIVHSYSQEYPWTKRQHEAFVAELASRQEGDILFSTEHLDTKNIAYDRKYIEQFSAYLRMKYREVSPDAIYVTDDNAADFAIHHLSRLFPDAAIVFSGVNDYSLADQIDRTRVTGVFEKKEIAPNLRIIQSTGASDGKIAFIGDGSETYDAIKAEILQELQAYPGIEAVFIADADINAVVSQLKSYPYRSAFLTTIGRIKDGGEQLPVPVILRQLRTAGDFILLSMEDAYLEEGILGGYVTSGYAQGQAAARLVAKHLAGSRIQDLPPITTSPNQFIFDQRALTRHNLAIPAEVLSETTILNPAPTFYQTNRTLIIASLVVLAVLLFVTLGLSVVLTARKNRQIKRVAVALNERHTQLLQTKESLVEAQRIAGMGSWSLHLSTGHLEWSDEIFRIFEIDKSRFPASYEAFLASIHPDDREKVNAAYLISVQERCDYEIQHRLQMPDGRIKYVLERGTTQYAADGTPVRSAGTVQDITERMQAEQRLKQWAAVFEHSQEGVLITDSQTRIIDVNRAYTEITGFSKDDVLGKTPNVRRSNYHDDSFYKLMWSTIRDTGSWCGEIWNRKKNGEASPEWLSISTIYDANGDISHYVGVFTDISERKRAEENLEYLANHDPLTHLPNRSRLQDRLERAILRGTRSGERIAVLFLDLDRFKPINDTLGHVFGDKLLRECAERMTGVLRESDTIGRQGGDEFVAIVEAFSETHELGAIAERIRVRVSEPFEIDGHTLFVGVSIGISVYPDDGTDASTLIRNADSAMYEAKRAGRNGFAFYDARLTAGARRRMEMDLALRKAIENPEFELYYQPKIDLGSGRLIGAEALIRWHHDGQLIRPDEFIPLAEETGLILPLGEWVLEESARQMKAWRDAGSVMAHLAVNLSAVQIKRGNIAAVIRRLLDRFGLPATIFEMEITETVLVDHPEQARRVLTELQEMGMALAMDDFGTGFSSLINLKQYPIDTIKIDRSFVRDLLTDVNDEAITRAVIAMGKSLELTVVAEGVEKQEQAEYLRAQGCDQAQGYLYSPPVPADEFHALWLSRGNSTGTAAGSGCGEGETLHGEALEEAAARQ